MYADPSDHAFSYNRRYIGDGIQMQEAIQETLSEEWTSPKGTRYGGRK